MNKINSFIVFSLLFIGSGFGQNLIQNPSFEEYSTCPVNQNQIEYATGWYNFGDSPDYFNSCSINPDFSVPYNWGGYQEAASGQAYSAFGTYISHKYNFTNVRDYIGGTINQLLQINTKYYFSFKLNLSYNTMIDANCASNKTGVTFSTIPYTWDNPPALSNNPHFFSTDTIQDTLNWTRISGSFIADSNYQYMMFGNFFDDNNTDTLIINSDNYCGYPYYLIDDICLSTDSIYAANYSYAGIDDNFLINKINIFPTVIYEKLYIKNTSNQSYEVEIYDLIGQLICKKENIIEEEIEINTSHIPSGFLHVLIKINNECYNYKLLKL